MSRFNSLADWLCWMENLHPVEIDLGLTRVYQVARKLGVIKSPGHISSELSGAFALPNTVVFTVAGTNGKGTCSATLTACLVAQGLRTGTYTSPHFHHYAERICIDGNPVDDSLICDAFAAIDQARDNISLSYFEFGTLAALWVFVQQKVDYAVLEVGLGGRLDAVNIVDTDVAIVTSIDIDHQAWLGDDRDTIAKEKLGICRKGRPLVITEASLTPALEQAARDYPSQLIDRDFWIETSQHNHAILIKGENQIALNVKGLHLHSVCAALVALAEKNCLPDSKTLNQCLAHLSVSGRCEHIVFNNIELIFDVAHNSAAVMALQQHLQNTPCDGQTLAVMAIMADKDYSAVIDILGIEVNCWFVGDLSGNTRALKAEVLAQQLEDKKQQFVHQEHIEQAFDKALFQAQPHDRIVMLGSFFTVAAIKEHISKL